MEVLIVFVVYNGSQAYQLFLEAYQLILWKQCHAMIHRKGFPDTFEVNILTEGPS